MCGGVGCDQAIRPGSVSSAASPCHCAACPSALKSCLAVFCAVSGAGAYGGLDQPAEDDTGLRSGGEALPAQAPSGPGKRAHVRQYASAGDTSTLATGTDVQAAPARHKGSTEEKSAPVQCSRVLTLIDDDA